MGEILFSGVMIVPLRADMSFLGGDACCDFAGDENAVKYSDGVSEGDRDR